MGTGLKMCQLESICQKSTSYALQAGKVMIKLSESNDCDSYKYKLCLFYNNSNASYDKLILRVCLLAQIEQLLQSCKMKETRLSGKARPVHPGDHFTISHAGVRYQTQDKLVSSQCVNHCACQATCYLDSCSCSYLYLAAGKLGVIDFVSVFCQKNIILLYLNCIEALPSYNIHTVLIIPPLMVDILLQILNIISKYIGRF